MEDNLRALIDFFENSPLSFSIYDERLCVIDINKTALKLIKKESKESVIGRSLEEISPGLKETGRLEMYENVLKTGKPVRLRSVVTTPSLDSKQVGIFAYKIENVLAIIAVDVAEWVEEEKGVITQLELKNKELEQFAYVASHDLQEPLETISSFVGVLQKKYEDRLDENANKYIGFIVSAAKRMQQLVRDVLEYSRVGKRREIHPVNLNDLINNVIADLEIIIRSNDAKINVEKLPVINADASDMKQLFQNLISNAIKYRKNDCSPLVHISCESENGNWKFAVKDNGIGIDEKFSERIFVIFQRLHNRSQYEGTGIGLALCKKIVEIYGGKIWIKSQPGTGTIFYFTIKELK